MDNWSNYSTKMKWIIMVLIIILAGCANIDHEELATEYKLDLDYYDYATGFVEINLIPQALGSCEQTRILRSECFSTVIQKMILSDISIDTKYCEEIIPGQKINMTMQAFKIVYPIIDNELKDELSIKLKPNNDRIVQLQRIKNNCLIFAN